MSLAALVERIRTPSVSLAPERNLSASNAWYPCLAKDSRQKLETVQNAAARTITGCTKNTNTKLLLNEAKLLPLEVESTISQSAVYERSLRLPETDPSRKTAENPVRTRLRSLGFWRETGKDKAYICGLEDFPREKQVPVPDIPPWQVPETFTCCATLGEGISKADAPEELKKAVEDHYNATFTCFGLGRLGGRGLKREAWRVKGVQRPIERG
ncbi:anoctamin [Elysia marginata]|uniref:Anoctamin n=1 Tax=Elysia marginata TaxID=1093978 RepID=A0AAV4HQM5_9GAST|nr:anoctamin [Elysia marginata]